MGRGFVFLFTIFAILFAKDKQCHGQGILRAIAEFENSISNMLSTLNRRTYGMQTMLSGLDYAIGGSRPGTGGPLSSLRGRSPLLNVLTLIDNFISSYIDPILQIYRDIKRVLAPIRQAIYQGTLYSLRSFNEFLVKQVKKFVNRPKLPQIIQNAVKNIFDKIKNRKRLINNLPKWKRRPLTQILSPFITGVVSQTLVNILSQIVLRKPVPLIKTVNDFLNRFFPTRDLPPVLKGRIVVNVVKLIQLVFKWLLNGLRRKAPRVSVMLLIFLLQYRIAEALVNTVNSIRSIIRSAIRIVMNIRTALKSRSSLSSRKIFGLVSRILGFFGIGSTTRSFPIITFIFQSIGTLFRSINLLPKISGVFGNSFQVISSLGSLAVRIKNFISRSQS